MSMAFVEQLAALDGAETVSYRDARKIAASADAEIAALRADVVRLKAKVNGVFDAIHEHTSRAAARRIFAAVKGLDPAIDAAHKEGES